MKYYFIDVTAICKETADTYHFNGIFKLKGPEYIMCMIEEKLKGRVLPNYTVELTFKSVNLL